jgi:hypothetical protein
MLGVLLIVPLVFTDELPKQLRLRRHPHPLPPQLRKSRKAFRATS